MAENQCVASAWSAARLFCRPEGYFPSGAGAKPLPAC